MNASDLISSFSLIGSANKNDVDFENAYSAGYALGELTNFYLKSENKSQIKNPATHFLLGYINASNNSYKNVSSILHYVDEWEFDLSYLNFALKNLESNLFDYSYSKVNQEGVQQIAEVLIIYF